MSKYWILSFITSFVIILGSLFLVIFIVRNRVDLEIYQQRYVPLSGGMEYSYTPKNNNLNIIVLHFKNPGLENKGSYKFSILDSDRSVIVSLAFTGFNIGDPTDLRLQFDPIYNSGNKNLIIRLDSQLIDANPISVGVDENGELAFSSYFRSASKFGEFKDVFRNLLFHIGKDPLFFGSLSMILFLIFWKWKKIR